MEGGDRTWVCRVWGQRTWSTLGYMVAVPHRPVGADGAVTCRVRALSKVGYAHVPLHSLTRLPTHVPTLTPLLVHPQAAPRPLHTLTPLLLSAATS